MTLTRCLAWEGVALYANFSTSAPESLTCLQVSACLSYCRVFCSVSCTAVLASNPTLTFPNLLVYQNPTLPCSPRSDLTLPYPTLLDPTIPYPTLPDPLTYDLPYLTLPYPTLPDPTRPYPTLA